MDPTLAQEHRGIVVRLFVYAAVLILTFIPAWRIFRRTGLSAWWSLLLLAPPPGVILILWIIAFRKWPKGTENPELGSQAPEAIATEKGRN